jgi:hypothetical protein
MCFSQFAQFEPRPSFEEAEPVSTRPEGAPPTKAELDSNLFGPVPTPQEWRVTQTADIPDNGHNHGTNGHNHGTNVEAKPAATVAAVSTQANGTAAITGVSTQTLEAVVVELANGTRLLICPL